MVFLNQRSHHWGAHPVPDYMCYDHPIPSHESHHRWSAQVSYPPTVLAARRAANEAYWVGHPSFDLDFGGTLSDYSGLMDF